MDVIYPGPESAEFSQDIDKLSALSSLMLKEMQSSAPLSEIIKTYNELLAVSVNLDAYTSCLLTTDTSNGTYLTANGKVGKAALAVDDCETKFCKYVLAHKSEIALPENEAYRFVLEEMVTEASHQMSDKEEALASALSLTGSDAWSRLQEAVSSSIEEGGKPVIDLRADAYSPDRDVRQKSYEAEIKCWRRHEVSFAYALNGIKGEVLTLEEKRGWGDPLDRSAFESRISRKALDALISTLEESLPLFRSYYRLKAEILGLDKLAFYDLFAPIGNASHRYSFDEAHKMVVDAYTGFSPEMGAFAEHAFSSGWIDAEPHRGKSGGAYDTAFPKSGVSRVFCNYDYSFDAVSTLAHELGHAYHDSVMMDKPVLLQSYPMTLAETASIFSEQVLFQETLKKTQDKDDRIMLIDHFLTSCAQVCVDILCRFYFERDAFAARRNGELTASDFCAMMTRAQDATYGDALSVGHEYMWAVKGHYYSADFSFYNYPYAFGQLFALSLFAQAEKHPGFDKTYRNVLERTGSMSADSVAASAGFDITGKAFWQSGITVVKSYVEMLASCRS